MKKTIFAALMLSTLFSVQAQAQDTQAVAPSSNADKTTWNHKICGAIPLFFCTSSAKRDVAAEFAGMEEMSVIPRDEAENKTVQAVEAKVKQANCQGGQAAGETVACWERVGLVVSKRTHAVAEMLDRHRKSYDYGMFTFQWDDQAQCGSNQGVLFDPVTRACTFIGTGEVYTSLSNQMSDVLSASLAAQHVTQ